MRYLNAKPSCKILGALFVYLMTIANLATAEELRLMCKTKKEAKDAYNKLEMNSNGEWIGKVSGWWYEKDNFIKTFEEEKLKGFINRELKIIWL